MRTRILFLFMVLIVLPLSAARAQDDPPDEAPAWPVIERCVEQVNTTPDDWTYPGVILLNGWAGLHGVSAEWATPHVISFDFYQGPLCDSRDSLSPDGLWYAVAMEHHTVNPYYGTRRAYVHEIRIYSTVSPDLNIAFPWEAEWSTWATHPEVNLHLRWWNNEQFIYSGALAGRGDVLINPFTQETTSWEGMSEATKNRGVFFPSPDWSRAVVDPDAEADWSIYDPHVSRRDPATNRIDDTKGRIVDLPELPRDTAVEWSPDARWFVVVTSVWPEDAGDYNSRILLYDVDGTPQALWFDGYFGRYGEYIENPLWSVDGRHVAFAVWRLIEGISRPTLYLADMDQRQIVDTCLSTVPRAWSPVGTQLVTMPGGNDQRPIQILDVERWQLVTVAYHDGDIIGWRE